MLLSYCDSTTNGSAIRTFNIFNDKNHAHIHICVKVIGISRIKIQFAILYISSLSNGNNARYPLPLSLQVKESCLLEVVVTL